MASFAIQLLGGASGLGGGSSVVSFESAGLSINTSASHELTHGLGGAPDVIEFWAVCTLDVSGYVAGEEVLIKADRFKLAGQANRGIVARRTATQILVQIGSSGVDYLAEDGATAIILSNTNWDLVVRAYRFA